MSDKLHVPGIIIIFEGGVIGGVIGGVTGGIIGGITGGGCSSSPNNNGGLCSITGMINYPVISAVSFSSSVLVQVPCTIRQTVWTPRMAPGW